jgi:threonine synthase
MSEPAPTFVCHGCKATVDIARDFPFACPNAGRENDDTDHVLVATPDGGQFVSGNEANPFLRYRALLSPYRLARFLGLPEDAWIEVVATLETQLLAVDGRSFRVTPMLQQPALAKAIASNAPLWVKDETGNVAGSHKARHLMGVMLYLRVLEVAKQRAADALRTRRLATASCGNAALAAAVVARASEWALDAYIPVDANLSVVTQLKALGVTIHVCKRRPGETGDPCMRAFRHAVRNGAIPFSVQGPENGLAIEGGRTLAFEMAETFATGGTPAAMFIQVGGGALASAVWQGLAMAARHRVIASVPKLILVQTTGCAPFARCWQQLSGVELFEAVRHRSRYMWPWAGTLASAATGILDDETYDWWEAAHGMRETGGDVVVVDEPAIERAYTLAKLHTEIGPSTTGAAGLAGLLTGAARHDSAAVVFSGRDL